LTISQRTYYYTLPPPPGHSFTLGCIPISILLGRPGAPVLLTKHLWAFIPPFTPCYSALIPTNYSCSSLEGNQKSDICTACFDHHSLLHFGPTPLVYACLYSHRHSARPTSIPSAFDEVLLGLYPSNGGTKKRKKRSGNSCANVLVEQGLAEKITLFVVSNWSNIF
jgi:hypothetical protein